MNIFIIFSLISLLSPFSYARRGGPETEADYIVPTPPQYVAFSRFKVKIINPYRGPQTNKISYIFPEFLIGEADRVISLTRIPGTENSWSSPELDAHCAVISDEFSCNVYIHRTQKNNACGTTMLKNTVGADFSREKALNHLPHLNLSDRELQGYAGVINSFYCHEPAGFLSYDIR